MANLISEFKTWNMFEILIKIYKEFHKKETKLNIMWKFWGLLT